MIIPKVRPYEEDKEDLGELYDRATETMEFRKKLLDRALADLGSKNSEKSIEEICEVLNSAKVADEESLNESLNSTGRWISDYLMANGYEPQVSTLLIKSMVLSAFPPIRSDPTYTPENLEESLVRSRQVMNLYLDIHRNDKRLSMASTFAGISAHRFYS